MSSLDHVLWVGGAAGAGKTTVASRLARRYGLRLYSADTRTWAHRDRALADGSPAAHRFEDLGPTGRWEQPGADLLAMSLHAERGEMVLEDLRDLPTSPLVVAEGTPLPAARAPTDAARAVWILPTPAFHATQLATRGITGGRATVYRLLAERIADEAHRAGVPVVTVDGSEGVDATLAAVEARFAATVVAGPTAAAPDERRTLVREGNLAVVAQVRQGHARPWATGDPEAMVRRFACECGSPTCAVDLDVTVGTAAAAAVLAPGHG